MINNLLRIAISEIFLSFCLFLLFVIDPQWPTTRENWITNKRSPYEYLFYFYFSFFILSITLCLLITSNTYFTFSNNLMTNFEAKNFLKQFIIIISILMLKFVSKYIEEKRLHVKGSYILYLHIILALFFMISVNSFFWLSCLVQIEALIICLFTGFLTDSAISRETAIKYLIFSILHFVVFCVFNNIQIFPPFKF
jgi:NADH:ubiquinone oxidoreductase subunit 2 (subunit N)